MDKSQGKLKVMHIHFWSDIRNSAGSVEKVITSFAAHADRYDSMIACCPAHWQKCDPSFLYHGIEVVSFRENALLNRVMNKALGLGVFTYQALTRLVHQYRPDILHFHNRQESVDDLVRRLRYRPKIVVHYHRHFAQPVIPETADLLMFISQATQAYIQGKVASKKPWTIVPNPLSIEVLQAAEGLTPEVLSDQVHNRAPVFLFGGGANPIKGGRELVEAFKAMNHPSARLIMAGRGIDAWNVDHPMIEVIGEIPARDFFGLMAKADMVIMPSYEEPFGLVAQEAMLLRKLLVTTGTGGLADFVDESCAIIVKPRSVPSLLEGLKQGVILLNDPARKSNYLDAAYQKISIFKPAHVNHVLETAYDMLFDKT